jgi:hypothetical protein
MSRLRTAVTIACLAGTAGLATSATAASRLDFADTIKAGKSSSVSVTVSRPAAFRLRLKAPTAGRTRLYLTGAKAPKGGALLDTNGGACQGAAGSYICEGAYESLPVGTYKFRILYTGTGTANVTLTARW